MDESTKSKIFKSQIEQAVGKKLDSLVFLATYKDDDQDRVIVNTNGELADHVKLLIILLHEQPQLALALSAYLNAFNDDEED